MLKFCEFLHRIRVIFYLRFRPLDVPMYAFGTNNEDFRSKSPYPLSAFEGSSFFELELPSIFLYKTHYLRIIIYISAVFSDLSDI